MTFFSLWWYNNFVEEQFVCIFVKGEIMNREKYKADNKLKWYVIGGGAACVAVVLLTLFSGIFDKLESGEVPQVVWLVITLTVVIAIIAMIAKATAISEQIKENNENVEKITSVMEQSLDVLNQIKKNTRLSETAKFIASRDADRESLREAVIEKLHRQDFEATNEIIKEIRLSSVYKDLAETRR